MGEDEGVQGMSLKDTIRELRRVNGAQWDAIAALERKLDVKTTAALSTLLSSGWKISGDKPTLDFEEIDQTDPAGRFRFQAAGGNFGLEIAKSENWGSQTIIFFVSGPDVTIGTASAIAGNANGTLLLSGGPRGTEGAVVRLKGEDNSNGNFTVLTRNAAKDGSIVRLDITGNASLALATWNAVEHLGFKTRDFQLGTVAVLTISGGVATIAHSSLRSLYYIDTQSSASTDDLDSFTTSNPSLGSSDVGRMLLIRAGHTDRTVVVKHGTGNILFSDETDRILDSTSKMLQLWWTGANWTDVAGGSKWWHEHDLSVSSLSKGASGATEVAADANTLGGWQLSDAGWLVNFGAHLEDIWDAVSDIEINVYFEVNVDNTAGNAGDTVDLKIVARYKGDGETAIKTQTVEVATVVGQSAQYKQFKATFAIAYDAGGNVIDALDVLSFVMNLETDTSEVDDIIINIVELRYRTNKPALEV
ncbi:hypothetical protein LCGC14_0369590 [marine sediment metagenome]|uniref:Uncharacterized protein n=1 Tax=marine sediment metagenome TaxID=412755 RepID=A0A0F9T5F4_9ZZZZ